MANSRLLYAKQMRLRKRGIYLASAKSKQWRGGPATPRIPPTSAGQTGVAIRVRDENIPLPRSWILQRKTKDPPLYAERKTN